MVDLIIGRPIIDCCSLFTSSFDIDMLISGSSVREVVSSEPIASSISGRL